MQTTLQKRTYNLDPMVIRRVRTLLDAKTDSEAIRKALDKTIEDHEIESAVKQLLKRGRFRSVYR